MTLPERDPNAYETRCDDCGQALPCGCLAEPDACIYCGRPIEDAAAHYPYYCGAICAIDASREGADR